MNIEFMCGLLANYSKELSEAETYREKGDVQLKHAKLIIDKVKNCSIPDVMRSAYFDIPNSEMTYATYSTKAYFDEQGWFLIDCDGKKQYEDEKWLKVSSHCA